MPRSDLFQTDQPTFSHGRSQIVTCAARPLGEREICPWSLEEYAQFKKPHEGSLLVLGTQHNISHCSTCLANLESLMHIQKGNNQLYSLVAGENSKQFFIPCAGLTTTTNYTLV
eukprot:Blabericola_migrator_1__2221@NODE_1611_length_4170_cov_36_688521_g1041_i1_p5_GENE_NODE_1611_length_4170_cov_36_688521_g1041_i1NODE_1611_length_4170_cov_36_688521_g1041_i1_p5_ORF_typecomplete_len114_score0_08OSTMP1/PF09777_9/0_015_NODE_1611_length_4170_cov_36_688521_g1041_i137584099